MVPTDHDSVSRPGQRGASNLTDRLLSPWSIGPPGKEIRVGNAEILLAQLPFFLNGWPIRRLPDLTAGDMDIKITEHPNNQIEVDLAGPGALNSMFDNEFDAADGLASALVSAYVSQQSDVLCLHAGTAKIGSGLVVLLGNSLAGKSSVAVQLASAGYRLFGDDRLAIRVGGDGQAVGRCLGLTPKVRLPLPADCGARFAEYVESFTEIRDEETAYLKLWEGEAAVFQEEAPLTAFIILNRSEGGGANLEPASRSQIVKAMMAQSFAPQFGSQALVQALTDLATNAVGYELGFSSSHEAASLLSVTIRGEAQA